MKAYAETDVTWFLTGPLVYLAVAVFFAGASHRIATLLRMPPHLRWALYPIPRGRLPATVFMAGEIFLLRKVYAQRPALWIGSLLLHWGLYAAAAFLVLLPFSAGAATAALGLAGMAAGLVGAIWLLVLRRVDEGLRAVSDRISYFNLFLLGGLFAAGVLAFLGRGVVHWASLTAAIVLSAVFVAYLPFSRMFHAPIKYFTYHEVFWDETRLAPGGRLEKGIAGALDSRPTWSAPHLRAGANWREQAAGGPGDKGDADGA